MVKSIAELRDLLEWCRHHGVTKIRLGTMEAELVTEREPTVIAVPDHGHEPREKEPEPGEVEDRDMFWSSSD